MVLRQVSFGGGGAELPFEVDPAEPPRLYNPAESSPFNLYDYVDGVFVRRFPLGRPAHILVVREETINAANLTMVNAALDAAGVTRDNVTVFPTNPSVITSYDAILGLGVGKTDLPPLDPTFPLFIVPAGTGVYHAKYISEAIGTALTYGSGASSQTMSLYSQYLPDSPLAALWGYVSKVIHTTVVGAVAIGQANLATFGGIGWGNAFGYPDRISIFELPNYHVAHFGYRMDYELTADGNTAFQMLLGEWLDGLETA